MKKIISLLLILMLLVPASITALASAAAPIEIVWLTVAPADAPNDTAKIVEAANKYSAEKIGVTVKLQYINEEGLRLALTTGENWDLSMADSGGNINFDNFARDGYFADITELLATETPDLYATMDEKFWEGASQNGSIYGIPVKKDMAAEIFFRIDEGYYTDTLGLEIPDEMKFEDIGKYLYAYKENRPNEYAMPLSRGGLTHYNGFLQMIMGRILVIPYYAVGTDKETTIIPWYENEEYLNRLRLLHQWYVDGIITPDAATTETLPATILSSVRSGQAWTGYKGWSNTGGLKVKLSRYDGPFMSRTSIQGAVQTINAGSSAEKQLAALKFVELLSTDTKFRDIFAYGIEGEHFNYLENGTVLRTDPGIENYNTTGWMYSTGSYVSASVESSKDAAGNIVLADPNLWIGVFEGYDKAIVSATGAYSFNREPVQAEASAVAAVMAKYEYEMNTGTLDIDAKLEDIIAELKYAGIDIVLAEAQAQLDAYLASVK
ncbi:MAG: ABC transporter substrate-binding protein [Oscillospiraceae bacterium]|jgi:putative aldouronate transport system substrate-binding protein|nr:ABC transporter substrate-binding protein [Oscillospiraceae bacterium]